MVALSLTISISRGSSHGSPTPSLNYQASIYSSHSQSYANGYKSSQDNSLEQLVPRHRAKFHNPQRYKARAQKAKDRMASTETAAVHIERKKSFGIGGAGNIRMWCLFLPSIMADDWDREAIGFNLSTEG